MPDWPVPGNGFWPGGGSSDARRAGTVTMARRGAVRRQREQRGQFDGNRFASPGILARDKRGEFLSPNGSEPAVATMSPRVVHHEAPCQAAASGT